MPEINEISEIIEDNNIPEPQNKYAEALNKYFKVVLILVAIIVFVAGYYWVIIPKLKIKADKDQGLAVLQAEVDQLKVDSDYLSKYSSTLIEFTPEEDHKLNLALPNDFDLPSILVQLTTLASSHGFVADNISANESSANVSSDSNIKRVDLAMKVTSANGNNYDNFGRFIAALESSLLIFDVRSISFRPDEIGYKLELVTYYYPLK
ncbi:MAG: hypothetical protein COU81_00550 [Candidatus Portnoybacteria bacterium CG10_big_fil_rev_8_21_14_0_10_36_7]|uniref:Pilus assembly protein PilO n=1 Tax=Candidatus Portnoybacteria bacterium CG10_big_fil_rev_8_21_14_0_10_36_7 TaxID=1974812 RepID=A0A2M8KEY6_9BACT|nr:MAG: hypothetical protein COU81_00550 [Candidatus Portnoybacteria bacterium CG10_big_fil_rev_8_21_14_0_10_36_7]